MTFTKLFSSITESTIWCEDDHTRLVWITMLAMCNKNGFVFASEPGLANRARVPLHSVLAALEKFSAPDRYSRSPEFDGRRIEKVDGGWRLLNYRKHRAIRDEEERKDYLKHYMREYRKQHTLTNVNDINHGKPPLSQAEAEAEAEEPKKQKHVFVRPSLEEVGQYIETRGGKISAEAFCDYYDSVGWKVNGKSTMKDWKAAVRTWEKRINDGPTGPFSTRVDTPAKCRAAANQRALLDAIATHTLERTVSDSDERKDGARSPLEPRLIKGF